MPPEAQQQLLEAMSQQMQGQSQEQPMEGGQQGMRQEASPDQVQEIARMGGMRPKKSGYSQMYR